MTSFARSLVLGVVLISGCANFAPSDGPSTKKEIRDDNRLVLKDDSGPRKRLLVLPFLDASATRGEALRMDAQNQTESALIRSGILAIDSHEVKGDFSKYLKNGEYDLQSAAKEAQALGIHAVLDGKILEIKVQRSSDPVGIFRQVKTKFEVLARVRVVTTRSGTEIFNTVKTISLEEANTRVAENLDSDRYLSNNPELVRKLVTDAFLDFTPQVALAMDKLNWEGRVAMINGDRIFLNVGKISGLQMGDILRVSDEGDEVFDPRSGNYIGKTPGRVKGTLEVVSYFGQDGSIAVIHSGSGFKESDRVELY